MRDHFSSDLRSLIDGLTAKDPKMRLGNPAKGGAGQIKLHPFFRKVDWGAVYRKELKPPIIPSKKKGVNDLTSGDANPYRLLE
jgi:hypothetical protein